MHPNKLAKTASLRLEPLEGRCVPAAFASFSGTDRASVPIHISAADFALPRGAAVLASPREPAAAGGTAVFPPASAPPAGRRGTPAAPPVTTLSRADGLTLAAVRAGTFAVRFSSDGPWRLDVFLV